MGEGEPTVLVVEDDVSLRRVNQRRLEAEYTVHTAGSGAEAITAIDDYTDVVLLDRSLPDMSGEEVLDWIREAAPECGVVVLSGHDPDELADAVDAYLVKPTTLHEVREAVAAAVPDRLTPIHGEE